MNIRTILLFVLSISFAVPSWSAESPAEAEPNDGIFIHLSHGTDDPHRVLMALNLATMMVEEHDVLVYFDIDAVHVVLKESEDIEFSHFPSSRTQLDKLLEAGATLMACPGCLKVAGKSKSDLIPGIELADKKQFFTFTEGRILSLDY
jgi:predicted peroxiredoxin